MSTMTGILVIKKQVRGVRVFAKSVILNLTSGNPDELEL